MAKSSACTHLISSRDEKGLALSQGQMVPTYPWDAMWFDSAAPAAPGVGSLEPAPDLAEAPIADSNPDEEVTEEAYEIVQKVTHACSQDVLLEMGISYCQQLCHGRWCCFVDSGPYSCKNDLSKHCDLYDGCGLWSSE